MTTTYTKQEEKAHQYLNDGEFGKAKQLFSEVYDVNGSAVTLNNLVLATFKLGKVKEALELVEENIQAHALFNPFAHALAAEMLVVLGRVDEAKQQVTQAILDFDHGLAKLQAEGVGDVNAWLEYAVVVMRAAGLTGDHRLVLGLYKRWQQYHLPVYSEYYAGVAAFNRKRFKLATSYWSGIHMDFAPDFAMIALMCERGVVPPFPFAYEDEKIAAVDFDETDMEARAAYMNKAPMRMRLLRTVFHPEVSLDSAEGALMTLIQYDNNWGTQFGLNLLDTSSIADPLKIVVAQELVALGVFGFGEPIPMYIQGKQRVVEITQREVILEADYDLEALYEKARALLAKGDIEAALSIVEEIYHEEIMYPPMMMLLANLYRRQERFLEAKDILEILEEVDPDDPALLFNFSGLWLQLDQFEKAQAYVKRLKNCKLDQEWRARLQMVEEQLAMYKTFKQVTEKFRLPRGSVRQDVEAKQLAQNTTLVQGLKNMPVAWLNGVCNYWRLTPARLRKDREKQIAGFLSAPDHLEVVTAVSASELALIQFLLAKGGWARLRMVTTKFGTMDDDDWSAGEPTSTLGKLWSKALVFVGTARINNRRTKIVTVPIEIRPLFT
ncbi:MAG: tetratricopeptide repeat protein [Firmicutes bacterium]|nr:tetratricopeptide repeat protein [Bacillota bacterium]